MSAPVITPAGDQAFYVRFASHIDPVLHSRVVAAARALEATSPPGVGEIVPGYASVLVHYQPLHLPATAVQTWIAATLGTLDDASIAAAPSTRRIVIPVCYHPDVAPDLVALASDKGLSVDQLVAQHAAPVYRCYQLGFRPGFPFLGGLPPALAAPRLATPRVRVPAGSVGIGGLQTGVYPVDSPGGWRLIGLTPLRLFDPTRTDPFLVHPGDEVTFLPIDRQELRTQGR